MLLFKNNIYYDNDMIVYIRYDLWFVPKFTRFFFFCNLKYVHFDIKSKKQINVL